MGMTLHYINAARNEQVALVMHHLRGVGNMFHVDEKDWNGFVGPMRRFETERIVFLLSHTLPLRAEYSSGGRKRTAIFQRMWICHTASAAHHARLVGWCNSH